ncbi:MAG TPA: TetR family transcriptional regulator, partial [Lentzea sp.]
LADALRKRGVTDPAASLAAEAGMAVFKVAFQRWAGQDGDGAGQTLAQIIAHSLAELKSVAAAG